MPSEFMLDEQLQSARLQAVCSSHFFATLRQCAVDDHDWATWTQLACTHFETCADADQCWNRFENDCMRLSRLLDAGDVASHRPMATVCFDAAADYVAHGVDGQRWRSTPRLLRARALFGLVAASEIPLHAALSRTTASQTPLASISTMQSALRLAGDLDGCLMV